MLKSALAVALLAPLQREVSAAVAADRVASLPGFAGDLPSEHFSGYMPVGELSGSKGHLHYWFIESEVCILPTRDILKISYYTTCVHVLFHTTFAELSSRV